MAAKRSFWDALQRVRDAQQLRAQIALGRAHEALVRAGAALQRATEALDAQRALAPQSPGEGGAQTALDLQRSAAFWLRHVHALHALRAHRQSAQREFTASQAAVREAQRALERTSTQQQLLERHRLRGRRMRLRKRDAGEQIEVEERIGSARAGRAN